MQVKGGREGGREGERKGGREGGKEGGKIKREEGRVRKERTEIVLFLCVSRRRRGRRSYRCRLGEMCWRCV